MYFQIENTPEHLKRARKKAVIKNESPKEECPRLVLAPFSRPPQVVFDNVLIGASCQRELEVLNPSKQIQKITLGKALPAGLVICLPEESLTVEPETCYCLTMVWTPMQPTALRETIRFTNENRGRYDVNVVLKAVMNLKKKNGQSKHKVSPGKIHKKTTKKSPIHIDKKKAETMFNNSVKIRTADIAGRKLCDVLKSSNKENISLNIEQTVNSRTNCPFDSPSSIDFNFNTSEVFSNVLHYKNEKVLYETYDKSYSSVISERLNVPAASNVLQPSNKQTTNTPGADIFDNLSFTPLKVVKNINENVKNVQKIILKIDSECEFDDSLDLKNENKENQTHSIIGIVSSKQHNKWLTENHRDKVEENNCTEAVTLQNKKIPNTSSPKEMNSPNFSINTDFSRISDLSFLPQRYSTERKIFPINNETHEIDEINSKLNSDTYTKISPYPPFEQLNQLIEMKQKMCRQALFKDSTQQQCKDVDRNYLMKPENNIWCNDFKSVQSSPRSLTPPLQSIPEESSQHSDNQTFNKTDKQLTTFTINRTFDKTFDKPFDRTSSSVTRQTTWSKKSQRIEPDLWKMPTPLARRESKTRNSVNSRNSITGKVNRTFEKTNETSQNLSLNQIGNIYSQSLTVDPFSSSTYFYDQNAVDKFETEFKRWLNYILTPPADLDSNIEQKFDVGKAWIENRNKEIPLAPTKEQVCSAYHNSYRLESLRKSARSLFLSPDITQVFTKLATQIERKLITIRHDRNLHLDIGLQKSIMELILSYNPLWLRVGLEAVYGIVLPLKSNNDVEGLTTFIIQRMFKNPHLKNKNSKSSAPNMLLPAYMEAIKKFTLKKFFMLVFFLDQAKQKKLILHDPCLFCRNAVCKESREMVIRFTRELIAGIGDITKHLRPLGYVVCHKQSYLDEYKFAVHNIAVDIRDGVRLTKVMEVILIKNGLLNQLRTPAISRLQKIHNVSVAFNALKDANFVIVGDITPTDIADGHREKTLSLLWQIIHVFRAPLFEKAANVIQIWWRKKYEVIVAKRKEEERILAERNKAASVIQYWWRTIQYNRMVEQKMYQINMATIVIQKFCRMWLCRSRLRRAKTSALKIADWYKRVRLIREAQAMLKTLKLKREELRRRSAIILQSYVRRWICVNKYRDVVRKIILIQSVVRCFLMRKQFLKAKESIKYVQKKYKNKLLMRNDMESYAKLKHCAVVIQSFVRMYQQRKRYLKLKATVRIIEDAYKALLEMRKCQTHYMKLKRYTVKLQAIYRGRRERKVYIRQRDLVIAVQRRIKANRAMVNERSKFLCIKNAVVTLQKHFKSYLIMKSLRLQYILQQKSAIFIQRFFRNYLKAKCERHYYVQLKKCASVVQARYRSILAMRVDRLAYLNLKKSAILLQNRYRALILMRRCKQNYDKLKRSTLVLQNRYRALLAMRKLRNEYLLMKKHCVKLQRHFRAHLLGRKQRIEYIKQKDAAVKIQNWFRSIKKGKQVKKQFEYTKTACITVQRLYRANVASKRQRQEYIRMRTATICIQRYFRSYILTRRIHREYIRIKISTVTIQRYYRSWIEMKRQRNRYLVIKKSVVIIQNYFRCYRQTKRLADDYQKLREATIIIQRRYRCLRLMKVHRTTFMNIKEQVVQIQRRYRALLQMRKTRESYLKQRSAAIVLQQRFRALCTMRGEREKYLRTLKACVTIQSHYMAYRLGVRERNNYLIIKKAIINLQQRYRAKLCMRRERQYFLAVRAAAVTIQERYRAKKVMQTLRSEYIQMVLACVTIQRHYRAYRLGKEHRQRYINIRKVTIQIQTRYREIKEARRIRYNYLKLRQMVIIVQRHIRARNKMRQEARENAATRIQMWYDSIKKRNKCYRDYMSIRKKVILLQSLFRMCLMRKRYNKIINATTKIQSYYRNYVLAKTAKQNYVRIKKSIINLQAHVRCFIQRKRFLRLRNAVNLIKAMYRFKKRRDEIREKRLVAATCIQKYIRRYLQRSWYKNYRKQIIFIQTTWRSKRLSKLIRGEFLQRKQLIIRLQSSIRGYLVRKHVEAKREYLVKLKEEKQRNHAASIIQALFRGHKARMASDRRVRELRRRWRDGGLKSSQDSLKDRNEEAMDVLRNMSDIETVIRAFRSLELLTEVFPMMYNSNASSVVRRVHIYMSVTNRSISSIELLQSAASILVNLARYKVTGPKIYDRERIEPVLKFMWRFSNSEGQLFCKLSTYLWLFSKYECVKKDLTEFLHVPDNHKMLVAIKEHVLRMKRMVSNVQRNKLNTPKPSKFHSRSMNMSIRDSINLSIISNGSNCHTAMPALEPDYGIVRADKPRYFEDAEKAILCLFRTYNL